MNRLPVRLLLAGLLVLSACANRSIDEAYGVPDALDWSYFRAEPADVARAARLVLVQRGFNVEAIRDEGTVVVLSISSAPSSSDFTQVRIEPATFGEYRARAQTFPPERKLPAELEVAISAEL